VEEVATKFGCHGLQLVVAQRGCPVSSFSINKSGPGGMWERAFLAQPVDLGGADDAQPFSSTPGARVVGESNIS